VREIESELVVSYAARPVRGRNPEAELRTRTKIKRWPRSCAAAMAEHHGTSSEHASGGRVVIHIGRDLKRWANTPGDIEVRAGDVLVIPRGRTL